MTEINYAELPQAAAFTCLEEKFLHGANAFRKGNVYQVEDYADIDQPEVVMFFKAGWVSVEGWPDPPARDPSRKIVLDVHNIRHFGTSPKLGEANG